MTNTAPLTKTRAQRAKKRRTGETVFFWAVIMPITVIGLILGSLNFGRETRVEGQIIPPAGMMLSNEVWIVTDFSALASGLAQDLAEERMPNSQEIQERGEHFQSAQADIASRDEHIRLIQEQISAAQYEMASFVQSSRDAEQQIRDVVGAQIDNGYQSQLNQLKQEISARAKSINLKYRLDNTLKSPETMAKIYRLALDNAPPAVDTSKESAWLEKRMRQWRSQQKKIDLLKKQMKERAGQIELARASKVDELNRKIEDLQQEVTGALNAEAPVKTVLQQAHEDLALAQADDAKLDAKYYEQLYALPEASIVNHCRIPLTTQGRFSWAVDDFFADDNQPHSFWIFARATRADGRQYWALHNFSIGKNQTVQLIIEPAGFISTKAILRPNLSPEEVDQ